MRNKIKKIRQEKAYILIRAIITIVFLTIFIIIGFRVLPVVQSMTTESGRMIFKENVKSMGIKGPLYVLGIQVLQMVVAIIPGEPVEMAASMCFGFSGGIILCLIGFFIGSLLIFLIVRSLGIGFVQLFFSKEKIDNIKNKGYFNNPAKFEAALFIIFIIPGIPKDIFLYVAGLSPVKLSRFLPLATFARLPALVISNYAGTRISEGKLGQAVLLYSITLAIGLLAVYISSKRSKKIGKKNNVLM